MSVSENPYRAAADELPAIGGPWRFRLRHFFLILGGLFLLAFLLLPVSRSAPEAARRMNCSSNIRSVGAALLSYEMDYGSLPPAYTVDRHGEKLHSWRTLLLPYLERADVYAKVDFAKPWDHPANDAARRATIGAFRCPSAKIPGNQTLYMTVLSENSVLRSQHGRRLADVTDGPSNTLVIVEADTTHSTHWMCPEDLDLDSFLASSNASKTAHWGGRHVFMLDGAVRFLPNDCDREFWRSMITLDGNEELPELPGY